MPGWFRSRRRARILAQPFPAGWDAWIDEHVAMARRLGPAERQRLRELVQVFVAERHWEGCGGLELTDEHKVTIAAQACFLLLGRDEDLYDDVQSILVYPSTVIAPPRALGLFEQPTAPVAEGSALLGQAMLGGPVVLAWDAVLAGAREESWGNVVVHELAHKIDMANGRVDGVPPLASRAERARWQAVCSAAFADHRARVELGWPTVIDPYGATNEAEFFAVATETFVAHPHELAAEAPALFALLADFYRLVPAGRA